MPRGIFDRKDFLPNFLIRFPTPRQAAGMRSLSRFKKQVLNHGTGSTPINAEVADFPGFF
jgi:hypothetical protein